MLNRKLPMIMIATLAALATACGATNAAESSSVKAVGAAKSLSCRTYNWTSHDAQDFQASTKTNDVTTKSIADGLDVSFYPDEANNLLRVIFHPSQDQSTTPEDLGGGDVALGSAFTLSIRYNSELIDVSCK